MQLLWDRGTKVCSIGPGLMAKIAAMPIYSKNLKNLLLWNQKADDVETWYAASGGRVLPVPYAFVWQTCKTQDFSETIVVYDIKVGRCS